MKEKIRKETRNNILVLIRFLICMVFTAWLINGSQKYAESQETKAEEPEIEFFMPNSSNKDMLEFLENRNGKLVIEICEGKVLDDEGNGESHYSDGKYYIKYDPNEYKKGDEVLSIFVYNPNTEYIDDITHRVDIKK